MNSPPTGDSPDSAASADKRLVGRSFGQAAPGYDAVAQLQRRVGDSLLEGLAGDPAPASVLDVGAGTGYCTRRLRQRFPGSRIVAIDLAEGMLHRARDGLGRGGRLAFVCADAERLPLPDATMDLLVSNLTLQWCADLDAVFTEFRRVLKPGGTLLFSSFGPATLQELRQAWAQVDRYSHVLTFPAPQRVADIMAAAGLGHIGVRSTQQMLVYSGVDALMRELKGLGARNLTSQRPRHLMGKQAMRHMMEAYAAREADGRIGASFETVFGQARKI